MRSQATGNMRGTTPQRPGSALGDRRRSVTGSIAARNSIGPGGRASIGGSGIPRVQSRISSVRTANQQPAFDFLTGAEINEPPNRASVLRERVVSNDKERGASADERETTDLKAEIKALKYSISTRDQEQELAKIRQESEIREIRRKGDEDFKKMQAAEGEKLKATRAHELLMKEVGALKDKAENERAALERKLRDVEERRRVAEEEAEDAKAEKEDSVRSLERKLADLEANNRSLKEALDGLQEDAEKGGLGLQTAQQALQDKDSQIGRLEGEVLQLKSQTGDADALIVIKRELSEQVTHIRTLEMSNRESTRELEHYKALYKSVEVVEEEKRGLQRKVDTMEDLQQELGEARLQRQRLDDERLAWNAYFQNSAGEDGQPEFESPEDVVKALVNERLQTAEMLEKLGAIEPQLFEKDDIIKSLEAEKSKFRAELEKARTAPSGGDAKAMTRLERQKTLAIKEVEYLKAQLKALDTEESTMELPSFSEEKSQRISQLEDMVEQYRQEVQNLHDELKAAKVQDSLSPTLGSKRPREEPDESEQLGKLSRKNRKLQDELSTLQKTTTSLQKDLSVAQERLKASLQHSKTRILSLRSNPTSDHEAIKASTLTALQAENAALLSQLRKGELPLTHVPMETLEAKEFEFKALEKEVKSKEKHMMRLKQIWGAKTNEFREAISSLLGWKVEFMPNGKMKVTSLFFPSSEDSENSIVFDGENGSMKVSGGPKSLFAMKIRDQIKFWVTERSEVPLLLAALTMEFYEESSRADGQ